MPASLGLFAGIVADHHSNGNDLFCELPSPRARPRRGWRVPRSPSGWPVLFAGWIDNRAELAAKLSLRIADPAVLYGAAVERWGDAADREIVGDYSALVCLPDDTVRIARSPYAHRGLFWHANGETLLVASIPRPIFAAGLPRRLRQEAIDALISMQLWSGERAQFEDLWRLPMGQIAILGRRGEPIRTVDWYDPSAVPRIRFRRDEDYVAAANELLAEAVGKALEPVAKPAIALSGGLDSPLVCAEALRQLPPGKRLTAITFGPVAEWKGAVWPHKFGDDRPFVAEFARQYPALETVFIDNAGVRYDDRAVELFLASDSGYPARVVSSVHHRVYEAARQQGCDWLLTAWMGNDTFSQTPAWAMPELFRTGHWLEMWRMADARVGDWRPVWRRCVALGLLPNLPAEWRRGARSLVHGPGSGTVSANPFLRPDAALGRLGRDENLTQGVMAAVDFRSREEVVRHVYNGGGDAPEVSAGFEQVFGVRERDVTAYRPLIEFCNGVPTDQYVRHGETRWLAKRMAVGRMPERQRLNPLYGEQNPDWHERMTPYLPELRRDLARLAEHPELSDVIDVDRAVAALDDWPEESTLDPALVNQYRLFLPGIAYLGRYLDFVSGRNTPP